MKENNPILMDAKELEHYLGISKNAVYNLLNKSGFPTVKSGSRLFAVRAEVDKWIQQELQKGGYDG